MHVILLMPINLLIISDTDSLYSSCDICVTLLTLKASITTAADDTFKYIFFHIFFLRK